MVDDALDLEADLGVDSPQRAELWGELVERYGLGGRARRALRPGCGAGPGGGADHSPTRPAFGR